VDRFLVVAFWAAVFGIVNTAAMFAVGFIAHFFWIALWAGWHVAELISGL
jgi:hypothetical protein